MPFCINETKSNSIVYTSVANLQKNSEIGKRKYRKKKKMLNRFSTLVEDNMMQNRQGTWDEVLCLGFRGERRSFRYKAYSTN